MFRTTLFFAILFFTTTVAAQDTLRPGNVVGGSVSDSDTVSYVIDVAAEHFIMGDVTDLTGNAIIQLLDPEGRQGGEVAGQRADEAGARVTLSF